MGLGTIATCCQVAACEAFLYVYSVEGEKYRRAENLDHRVAGLVPSRFPRLGFFTQGSLLCKSEMGYCMLQLSLSEGRQPTQQFSTSYGAIPPWGEVLSHGSLVARMDFRDKHGGNLSLFVVIIMKHLRQLVFLQKSGLLSAQSDAYIGSVK